MVVEWEGREREGRRGERKVERGASADASEKKKALSVFRQFCQRDLGILSQPGMLGREARTVEVAN